ncbi:hypothetical protein PspKH34_22410 [Parageobacillus sp. KH3-4]|uniref:Uncharacterized protein n=1 Tax=Parageobacillus thermoglucosidasius TaxID=1426 RepID=A0A1B7KN19_PARTM|nr:hypothetical protein A7K69_13770 [Parageobacillus thermoglucosidasius]BDG47680.1 hypothetical protein PspKH34_22410 [Parageobacillus sp. KH3-4]
MIIPITKPVPNPAAIPPNKPKPFLSANAAVSEANAVMEPTLSSEIEQEFIITNQLYMIYKTNIEIQKHL